MNNVFNILDYGAVADGVTNNAPAIQAAIDAATVCGGQVIVPSGEFLSGTIVLKSNIDFHLCPGAVLIASLSEDDVKEFDELRGSNEMACWKGGCFMFAKDECNVTVSGPGTIYGQGDKVFFDDDADGGFHECPLNVTAFRPRTTFFENVRNLTIKEINIKSAARWTLHMAGCSYVTVDSVKIFNDIRGANTDGIDADCCKNVIITNCMVETGDDAIVIKTAEPVTKLYGSCENIVVSNCILSSRDSAVKIGTETHGDIRNITIGDCIIRDCSRGIGIWVRDGGTIEDIRLHHLRGSVLKYADAKRPKGLPSSWWGNGEPVFINNTYRNEEKKYSGIIRNISVDHIDIKAESSVFVAGEEDCVVSNIYMTDLNIEMCSQGTQQRGYFDEQPSIRGVYAHSIPVVYGRNVDEMYVSGRVRYVAPYNIDENPHFELENCTSSLVEIKSSNK